VGTEATLEVGKQISLAVESLKLPQGLLDLFSSAKAVCTREGQCWDFKRDQIPDDALALGELCRDIAGFFNAYGGFIVLGVEEVEKDLRFQAVGLNNASFPMQRLKGLLSKYLSVVPEVVYDEYSVGMPSNKVVIAALAVPKRVSTTPAKFLARGPEKKSKPIFDVDQMAIRRGDQTRIVTSLEDWQLISGDRRLDEIGLEIGRFSPSNSALAISHNLPTRSAICRRFVGRKDYLRALWEWLSDEFQYCRVVAGDGGKGKTSLAYEFSTQVARVAPCGFTRVVWLTAKKKQFHAESNEWREMHQTHFSDFRTLLVAVGEHLGFHTEELEGMSDPQLNRAVRQLIAVQSTLFVFDDLDSLVPDDQKRTLEFASQVGKPDVRFLLTTRSNASYSSDLCLTLRGLDQPDFGELIDVLVARYGIQIPKQLRTTLHEKTDGSPLLLDSILRLIACGGDPARSIKEWSGAAGEDARRAVLQKEIDLLSVEAKRTLLCIAYFGQCSLAEVQQVSALPATRLDDCLRELESLFLVDAPKIIESQPRYEMNATAVSLVLSQREVLAFDHAKIQKQVAAIRAPLGKGAQAGRDKIGRAVSQAMALARAGKYSDALETVNVALKQNKSSGDLLLLRARLGMNSGLLDLEACRRDLREAHRRGCKKPLLFEVWLEAERRARFGPGVIEVCDHAVHSSPDDEGCWAERRAEGYVLNAYAQSRSGNPAGAAEELTHAADQVYRGVRSGDASDSAVENLALLHDRILAYRTTQGDAGLVVDSVREALKRGDTRHEILETAYLALRKLLAGQKAGRTRDWAIAQAEYFAAGLRASGADGAVLARQFEGLTAKAEVSA